MAEVAKIDIDGVEWDIRDDILTARFEQFLQQRETQRNYSTSEVNTGKKWINGKPIYRVTKHVYHNGSVVTGYTYDSSSNNFIGSFTTNAETIVTIRSNFTDSSNRQGVQYTQGYGSTGNILWVNNNTVYNRIAEQWKENYITIEYTKTTD